MSLMSEREALDLYEAVRYNLPNSKFKEAVDIAFCALVKQIVPDTNVGRKTNADHIRSMSDEELAVLFGAMCAVAECHSPDGHVCPFIEDCPIDALGDKLWPNWLKQPYKEDKFG